MKPVVIIAIAVMLLVPTSAFADTFRMQTECDGTSLVITIRDDEGELLSNAKIMTIKSLTGQGGYRDKYLSDENGEVIIPLGHNTGYVWLTKGGFNDVKKPVQYCHHNIPKPETPVVNNYVKSWSNNLFEWHQKKLITTTEFINAIGHLTERNMIQLEKTTGTTGRNISHTPSPEMLKAYPELRKYYERDTYDYNSHETTVWTYKHSSGWEYTITKSYDGILSTYIDGNYIYTDLEVRCAWC